ncbi:hypothetical protein FRC02_009347 [Tulasnella sp. 418]|nr:hypothetical protein FRC02_009347 [Tulasnella sp. 418]
MKGTDVQLENAVQAPTVQEIQGIAGWYQRHFGVIDSKEIYDAAVAHCAGGIDPVEELKLVRKVDYRIIPLLGVCYAFYYIDKTTLSYAALFGIREDLHLNSNEYSWLGSIFYWGWLVWAVPGNLLMQKMAIGKYLGINIFFWGFFLAWQALTHGFPAMAVLRFISGACEAVADPCFMFVTAMWYTRREQPIRIGLWYLANGVGVAFGGIIGYGIGQISSHIPNWRLEFLIVGLCCCLWGAMIFMLVPGSPVTARWLTQEQRWIAIARLSGNQTGIENKTFKWYQFKEALIDPKTYLFFLFAVSGNVPSAGISNFGTLIVKGLGYNQVVTTLLQIPYGAFISLVILLCIWINHRAPTNSRTMVMAISILPNLAGTLGLVFIPSEHKVARLICYYLTGISNAAFVLGLSLVTGNVGGHTKKLIANAATGLGMCVGNIIGPFFYKTAQAPRYQLGMGSMVFSNIMKLVIVLIFRYMFMWQNRVRDRRAAEREASGEAKGPSADETAFSDMTDWENPNFRYVY